MVFIRQKFSVLISYALLALFFSIGISESLHHHIGGKNDGGISFHKDPNATSVEKYQIPCELCKAISSHHHLLFDLPAFSHTAFISAEQKLAYAIQTEEKFDSTVLSIVNKGPPNA